jgi:hypothetical protein
MLLRHLMASMSPRVVGSTTQPSALIGFAIAS